MMRWERLIRQGNADFDDSDFAMAARRYREALAIAQADLDVMPAQCTRVTAQEADDRLAAYVVTCQNLADTDAAVDVPDGDRLVALCTRLHRLVSELADRPDLQDLVRCHAGRVRLDMLQRFQARKQTPPTFLPCGIGGRHHPDGLAH